ncbi:hypothetical protein OO012_16970 [Rhodobacteraceae bacterium KMM 6894]|nr:hypothetical protein [Rhodobacteraceae bacterium KMM 6894]
MTLGLRIFLHALRMVWTNRAMALRIGLLPALLMIVATVVLREPGTPIWTMGHAQTFLVVLINAFQSENAFLLMLVWAFASVWTFVNWHRFILLAEYPKGWFPPVHKDVGLAYVIAATKLIGFWLVSIFILIFVAAIALRGSGWVLLLGNVILIYIILRVSPTLPAAALGVKMGAMEAFVSTQMVSGAILLIMATRYGVDRAVQLVVEGAADVNEGLGLILWVGLTLFLSLVNASILTTLYGYCVQGRSLA